MFFHEQFLYSSQLISWLARLSGAPFFIPKIFHSMVLEVSMNILWCFLLGIGLRVTLSTYTLRGSLKWFWHCSFCALLVWVTSSPLKVGNPLFLALVVSFLLQQIPSIISSPPFHIQCPSFSWITTHVSEAFSSKNKSVVTLCRDSEVHLLDWGMPQWPRLRECDKNRPRQADRLTRHM